MKKLKKALALGMAAAMALSMTACIGSGDSSSGSSSGGGEGSGATPTDVELTGEVNKYGWEVPKETIKFSYYYAGDNTLDQAEEDERLQQVADVLKDEFNVEIERIVYKQDATERLNLMLAGDEYPDVIVGMPDDMAETFIDQDRALELTPYLEKYGQNLIDGFGDYLNLLKDDDGNLYKLAYSWGHTTDVMGRDFSIRYDLLQEAGLPMYDSFESYYETVKKLVELNPTNEQGEKTYGFTAFSEKGEEFYKTPLAYMGLYGVSSGTNTSGGTITHYYKQNDDGSITHWVDTEEGLEVAKYINRFWREGLIDPDFQTKDYDSALAFMSNERVVGNIGTWWHSYVGGHQVWQSTEEDWTIDKRMQCVTFEETDATPALISDNFIRTTRNIITDKCDNPEEVMLFWNWECTPMGVAFTSMGPEGEGRPWSIDEDGNCKVNDWYWYGKDGDNTFLWDSWENEMGSGNYWMAAPGYTPENRVDDPSEGWADPVAAVNEWDLVPNFDEMDQSRLAPGQQIQKLNQETSKAYVWDQTLWTISFSPDDPEKIINQDIADHISSAWVEIVMADTEEECVELFEQMREDLHSMGLDDLVAYQQETLEKNTAKFNGTSAE